MTKFCKDCQHRLVRTQPIHGPDLSECAVSLDNNDSDYLVTGERKRLYCSVARMPGANCGPDGKLWEPTAGVGTLKAVREGFIK